MFSETLSVGWQVPQVSARHVTPSGGSVKTSARLVTPSGGSVASRLPQRDAPTGGAPVSRLCELYGGGGGNLGLQGDLELYLNP